MSYGHVTKFLKFWDSLHISISDKATGVKFGMENDVKCPKQKYKIGSKGAWTRARDLLLKFWDPSISPERTKLETPNLACKRKLRCTMQLMQNWVKGAWPRVT